MSVPAKPKEEAIDNLKSESNASVDNSPVPENNVQFGAGAETKDPVVVPLPPEIEVSKIASPDVSSSREELMVKEGIDSIISFFYQTPFLKRLFWGISDEIPQFENTFKSFILAKLKLYASILSREDRVRLSPGKDQNPFSLGKRVTKLDRCGYPEIFAVMSKMPDSINAAVLEKVRNLNTFDGDDPAVNEKMPIFTLPQHRELIETLDTLNQNRMVDISIFYSFLRNLNSFEYSLKPLPDYDPRFKKMILAGEMQSLYEMISDNQFMRRPYYELIFRLIGSRMAIPMRPADKMFTDLLSALNISTASFSVLSQVPSALTSGQATQFEAHVMACSFLNTLCSVRVELNVLEPSPSAVMGMVVLKLMLEYRVTEPMTVNMIDNYLLRHFIRFLTGYRPQFEIWNDTIAKDGTRNYLTESLDNGVLQGRLYDLVRNFFYTPVINDTGMGWAEGGQFINVDIPTGSEPSGARVQLGLINSTQRDIHYAPTSGVPAFNSDCQVPQFDKFTEFVSELERQRIPFTFSGNERKIGDAYVSLLKVFARRKESFQMRAWRLDQLKRSIGMSSVIMPHSGRSRREYLGGRPVVTLLSPIFIDPLDAVSSFILSDFTTVNTTSPNDMLDLINLGFDWQDSMDRFCEIYWFLKGRPGEPGLFVSDNGFTKRERWEGAFDIYASGSGGQKNPVITMLKDALLDGDNPNLDTVRVPDVTLSPELSFVSKMDLVERVFVTPLSDKFKFMREFFLGTREAAPGRVFKRDFEPIPDPTQSINRLQLDDLKYEKRITPALKRGLLNEESIRFQVPVKIVDVVTDGSIKQDRMLLDVGSEGSVRVNGPIKQFLTFEDMVVFENSNDKLYDEVPRWSTRGRTFFVLSEADFYDHCLGSYTFLKTNVTITKTSDRSIFAFEQKR